MERLVLTLLVILSLGTALPIPSPDPAPAIGEALMPLGFNTLIFHENFSDVAENEPPSAQKWAVDEGTSYPGGPSKWYVYTRSLDVPGVSCIRLFGAWLRTSLLSVYVAGGIYTLEPRVVRRLVY